MTPQELSVILEAHAKWLIDEDSGEGANLQGANLHGANLQDANLWGANLQGANLRGANLQGANLRVAYLRSANLQVAYLRSANLWGANLWGANLQGANLQGANLQDANLWGANLLGANLRGANLPAYQICDGDLLVWKSGADGHLINLKIPAKAKRTASLIGRKCRAEYAKILLILDRSGGSVQSCGGWKNKDFIYKVGATVRPDSYDDDPRVECTNGIHFFMTKKEAEEWQ